MLRAAVVLLCLTLSPFVSDASQLDVILERGYVLVGTTGDYRPFSYRRADGELEGFDVDAAGLLAEALGVELRFVMTSWPELVEGILAGRYDLAMSGISRTLTRATRVGLSEPYFALGKCPLIRTTDRTRFTSLETIDEPGVRVGVNPGGTNEAFVRDHLKRARIVVIEDNLAIPNALAAGKVDVMITDNVEASLVARERSELYAVAPDSPFDRGELSYMVKRDDQAFLNWLNLWLHEVETTGELERLRKKWIP